MIIILKTDINNILITQIVIKKAEMLVIMVEERTYRNILSIATIKTEEGQGQRIGNNWQKHPLDSHQVSR
jgi:hypothetical protein